MKIIELIMSALMRWIQVKNTPPVINTSRTPTPPPMHDVDVGVPTYHISLYLKDGTAQTRARFNDQYCIRTDGHVYVKDKGKWVCMPDVIGLSFYKKNI